MPKTDVVKVAVLGASGYTGAELVRLLAGHRHARLTALTADRRAGRPMAEVFPHLRLLELPDLVAVDDVDFDDVDVVFCALPHGTTQPVIAALPERLKVVDLSADFRLFDPEVYATWYGHPHQATALQETAIYGLTELKRSMVRKARLVANPGCYPTAALLPLMPLLEGDLIEPSGIVIDAKSGVTGAGRTPKEGTLFAEVTEGIHAYAVGSHRHAPEIDQELTRAAKRPVIANFTPHLMPMARGILASIYVTCAEDFDADGLRAALADAYAKEPFVHVLPEGESPRTSHVRGTNHCLIAVFQDRIPGRAIVVSAIDNLVKGASGQAVQNMNAMVGFAETEGLEVLPLVP